MTRTSTAVLFGLSLCLGLFTWRPAIGGVPTQLKPDKVRGADLYTVNCWMCHGQKGLGDGPAAKSLRTPVPSLAGGTGPIETAADLVMQGSGDMPGFTETLNRKDAVRILQWLNSLDPVTGEAEESP
jgi:mono/diheme cytochrome c family protein